MFTLPKWVVYDIVLTTSMYVNAHGSWDVLRLIYAYEGGWAFALQSGSAVVPPQSKQQEELFNVIHPVFTWVCLNRVPKNPMVGHSFLLNGNSKDILQF